MKKLQIFRAWCKRLVRRKPQRLPRISSLRVDIAHNPPMLVLLDPASQDKKAQAFGQDGLNAETMRRLLLSVDHTSSSGH